jgi:hypothetical protein
MNGTATPSTGLDDKEPIFLCLYCDQKKVRLQGR